jgi:N-sulfoglucosamine sulfohydrolase
MAGRQSTLTRRDFLAGFGASAAGLALARYAFAEKPEPSRLNVLYITADDLGADSLGVFGCGLPGISPNIDALAAEGMRFERAHVTVAVCQPCRSVWMTGRYPHRNGAMGFQPINLDVPTLPATLSKSGYFNGIMAKVGHLAPREKFAWDVVVEADDLNQGRDPALWYKHVKDFLKEARASGKPFFPMANSQDPHRPWPGSEVETQTRTNKNFPTASRHYKPEEIEVPGFLPDIPEVRTELAQYYSAVHRCDETVGQILRALKEEGLEDNTIVFFQSDNGASFPTAKSCVYNHSTRTPLIVRWPGKVKAGSVNREDFVSGIDMMPTVLDAAGVPQVDGMDGRSFLPLLRGEKQSGREKVVTVYHKTSANNEYPMRCVRNGRFAYIFNGWADGRTVYKAEPLGGISFKGMQSAAEKDPKLAERVRFIQYRAPEEFYDMEADPNELNNLIGDSKHKPTIEKMRAELLEWMVATKDPLLDAFKKQIG